MSNLRLLQTTTPHIALIPSAGIGHLIPYLRLAETLALEKCIVTIITPKPTVSFAESNLISRFLSTHPDMKQLEFQILPPSQSNSTTNDPFFLQYDAVNRSAHLLGPLLSSVSPPLSAIVSDLLVSTSLVSIVADLNLPNYILATTSARFLSLMVYLPTLLAEPNTKFGGDSDSVTVPGLASIPQSSIPPPFANPNHLFTELIRSNSRMIPQAKGVLVNTFDLFEPETLSALNSGSVLTSLPPFIPIGPLVPYESEDCLSLIWLDEQPEGSVVYVAFGSRTTMSKDQIRELGEGLEKSGYRFFWVIKGSIVDKDDKGDIGEVVGKLYAERNKNKAMMIKEWVNQEKVLAHPAIGGFVNHCGWNSVTEAALHGIPMLAWPLHGDQRVNAEVVEKAGLGIWERGWGWNGEKLVKAEEIGKKVKEIMSNAKGNIADKNDEEEIGAVLGKSYMGRNKKKAM
ncbi:UDP-glucuronosyl/UDP-glucosyltransferase [Dillenia turbinata]|uniref:UDP-glucuronosyl/UDP-glucosyltransferase n=1 Tax=Dillenia turbinata TaxID=194707 RepID=A0AAN8VYU5_9MAGN